MIAFRYFVLASNYGRNQTRSLREVSLAYICLSQKYKSPNMLLLEHLLFSLSFTGQFNYDLVWFYYRFIITKWGDMALLASGLAVVGQAFTFEIFPQKPECEN